MSMSETVFRFSASELTTLRVLCKAAGCGGAVELPAAKLAAGTDALACPCCGTLLQAPGGILSALALALHRARGNVHFDVEFVLPVPAEK